MTDEPLCVIDARPVSDQARLCWPCTRKLETWLCEVTWLTEQLDLVIARETRYSDTAGRGVTQPPFVVTAETILTALDTTDHPEQRQRVIDRNDRGMSWTASRASGELKAVLVGWCRLIMEERDNHRPWPVDNAPAIAGWLLGETYWLRRHDAAEEAFAEVEHAHHRARVIVDAPRNRTKVYVCPCVEPGCMGEVHAYFPTDADQRPHMTCAADPVHTWPPEEWLRAGRRMLDARLKRQGEAQCSSTQPPPQLLSASLIAPSDAA